MNVADVMTPRSEVVTVELPGTRTDALEYLQERKFSSVPVVKRTDGTEEYRGLVSRESLIEHPDEDQLVMLLEEVPTVNEDAGLDELARLMLDAGARRVPVVDDAGNLAGIVTITDVVRAIASDEAGASGEVGPLASENVNTTYEGAPLAVAERELFYANVPYTILLDDDGDMSGILTEVDILEEAEIIEGQERTGDNFPDQDSEWAWEGIKAVGSRSLPTRNVEFPEGPAEAFMTADLVTVSRRRSAAEAAKLMIQHDVEQLPMVAGDRLVGVVEDVDLLGALEPAE